MSRGRWGQRNQTFSAYDAAARTVRAKVGERVKARARRKHDESAARERGVIGTTSAASSKRLVSCSGAAPIMAAGSRLRRCRPAEPFPMSPAAILGFGERQSIDGERATDEGRWKMLPEGSRSSGLRRQVQDAGDNCSDICVLEQQHFHGWPGS